MPDNEQEATSTPEVSTTDLINQFLESEEQTAETEETEETEAATADEGTAEEETEEEEESEAESEDDNDEEEDYLALDQSVAEKLPEDARRRYEQQVKGVQKRERQLGEREAKLQSDEKGYTVYQSYANAFSDPEHARAAYEQLGEALSKMHSWNGTDTPTVIEGEDGTYTYQGVQYLSETEVRLAKEIEALKAQRDPEIEEIKAEVRARKEAEAQKSWVDSNSQSIIAKVQGKTGGWGVTKDQIATAYRQNPEGMRKDPVQVLKSMNPDAYADWKSGTKAKKDVPDMITGSDSIGMGLPKDRSEWTFEQHAAYVLNGGD
jgi:hypothetical protein